MLTVTTETIQGKTLIQLGVVSGSTIQTKNAFHDIGASFKTIVGGELHSYTSMMEKARSQAMQRMVAAAEAMGADAVVGVRYATSAIMASAAEVLAYGTAVKFA
ncbi:MAG: YbjQ family protein [Bacteroidales bacterium]|nr:YbjQ family protein [Bacteroidales bacterium]